MHRMRKHKHITKTMHLLFPSTVSCSSTNSLSTIHAFFTSSLKVLLACRGPSGFQGLIFCDGAPDRGSDRLRRFRLCVTVAFPFDFLSFLLAMRTEVVHLLRGANKQPTKKRKHRTKQKQKSNQNR